MGLAKRLIGRAIGAGILKASRGVLTDPDGERYYVNPKIMHPFDAIGLKLGLYEASEREALRKGMIPASQVIELGPNIGVVSRMIQRGYLKEGAELLCVEANPQSHDILLRNLAEGARGSVQHTFSVVGAAIGTPEYDGQKLPFYIYRGLASGLSLHRRFKKCANVVDVPVVSLGTLLKDKRLADDATLVSDTEGAEHGLIQKEPDMLRRFNQMVIEFHETKLTGLPEGPNEMIRAIVDLGFNISARAGHTVAFKRRPRTIVPMHGR